MPQVEKTIKVANKKGLHARPAALMVQLASKFQSNVLISANGQQVNGKSIMGILTLGAVCDTPLLLNIDGPDAEQALQAFEEFLAKQED